MSRMVALFPVLLCCIATGALAQTSRPASPSNHGRPVPKAVRRLKTRHTRPQAAVVPAIAPIVGGGAHRADAPAGPAHGASADAAWSVSPEWNASNGGTSAAYGTRALVNELHANPGETTGYGAGAKVDFHF